MFSPDLLSICVKRHMNINFKTNLVAMLALASATALGPDTCLGMQNPANANTAVGTGIVQPVESSHAGAFGAVVPAPDTSNYHRSSKLPPIVSPSQASNKLPPIVTAQQQIQNEPVAAKLPAPKPRPKKTALLAPIKPTQPKSEAPGIDPTMAPPAIMQAANAFDNAADDSKVAQAAQWGPAGYVRTATSSAGVPLYPSSVAPAPPAISSQPARTPSNGAPPIISADSQLVSPGSYASAASVAALPPTTTLDPSYQPAAAGYSQGSGSTSFAQGSGSTSFAQGSGSTSFAQGSGSTSFSQGSGSTSGAIPQPNQPTTFSPQYLSGPPVEAPVISSPAPSACGQCSGGGCSDCGVAAAAGGGVTSNCQACGNNGCYNASSVLSRAGTSGLVPASRRYLLADALYFTRTDGDDIVNSNFGSLDGFDWNGGLRVTFGAKSDSLRGREITYQGIAEIEESETRTSAGGLIDTAFIPTGGLAAGSTSAFDNVTSQTESQSAEFHSLEFNSVTYGWDVIKSFAGFRFLYLEDDYQTNTTNLFGETGEFELQTINNLFGVHVGGEIFYDVGQRLSYSFASKAGVFVNFSQVDTQLTNNGIDFIDGDDDNATFSTSLEFNALAHYQLSQTARFRVGYNVLFIGEVATAQDNFDPLVTPISASQADDGDDIVFHGLNFGFEIFR